jgi:hypothetical protein
MLSPEELAELRRVAEEQAKQAEKLFAEMRRTKK